MNKFFALVAGAVLIGIIISRLPATRTPEVATPQSTGEKEISSAETNSDRIALKGELKSTGDPSRPARVQQADAGRSDKQPEATEPKPQGGPPSVPHSAPDTSAPQNPTPASPGEPEQPEATTERAQTDHPDPAALQHARSLLKNGKRIEARKLLSKLYLNSEPALRRSARKLLDLINKDLVFNPRCVEGAKIHVVKRGEMLITIAKRYKVNWRMIARLNGIGPPYRIREKQKLKIITGRPEIIVDKSEFRLALFINGAFIREYPVGHGKENKTPTGTLVVDQTLVRPPWFPPEGGVIHYGEKGYLIGERWLGFKNEPGASGLGIHGTNDAKSIGTMCSNGCIRMLNKDVIELYDFVVIGTKVKVVE